MQKRQVEVFRAGTFTASNGKTAKFTPKEVEGIAKIYDPTTAPAPVVVGHPQHDSPAWGWVSAFISDEKGTLIAELDQLEENFVEAVSAGRYRKISMSFFSPDHPANPKQGFNYPKHVGFLGGAAPAVSGLAPVEFVDDENAIEFCFDPLTASKRVEFSAKDRQLYRQNAIDRITAHYENEKYLDDLVRQGKLLPAYREDMLDFMAGLDVHDELSFSSGTQATQRKWFLNYLKNQPTLVHYGEMVFAEEEEIDEQVDFNAPEGTYIDPEDAKHLGYIRSYALKHNLDFSEAARIVGGRDMPRVNQKEMMFSPAAERALFGESDDNGS